MTKTFVLKNIFLNYIITTDLLSVLLFMKSFT